MIGIQKIIGTAIEAGIVIVEIYNSDDFNDEIKSDNSPLTRADLAVHNLIKEKLISLYPSIPILSEEGKDILHEERKNWDRFWFVDPSDGTKEFIKKMASSL